MNSVIFIPEVREYFKSLIPVLYENGYFSFREGARKYVKDLIDDIFKNLPTKTKKLAPLHFTDRYGERLYYATFHKSKHTQWYAFFIIYRVDGETYYQVRHIENNHTAAQYL